jgi:hypothetical protein
MSELAQVKAAIPKTLKREAFATFALQDEKFTRWLERELRAYVRECGGVEPSQYGRQPEEDVDRAGRACPKSSATSREELVSTERISNATYP